MVNLKDSRREYLEKVSELRKKRQEELDKIKKAKEEELKELEEKQKKELEEADALIQSNLDELAEGDEDEPAEVETTLTEEPEDEQSLEETVAREQVDEDEEKPVTYDIPIEEQVHNLYQQTDYNVYGDLKDTLNKVMRGEYLSNEEREEFYQRQEEIEHMQVSQQTIDEKDPFGYIERSRQVIQTIRKNMHGEQGGTYGQ